MLDVVKSETKAEPFVATVRAVARDEDGLFATFVGMSSGYLVPDHLAGIVTKAAETKHQLLITIARGEVVSCEAGPPAPPEVLGSFRQLGRNALGALSRLVHPASVPGGKSPPFTFK